MKNLIINKLVLLTVSLSFISILAAGQAQAQSYYSGYGETGETDFSSFANQLVSVDVYVDNAELAEQAKNLTAGAKSDYAKAKAIYNWVSRHIEYDEAASDDRANLQPDSPSENALETFHRGTGICGGYSALMISLLSSVGVATKYVIGNTPGSNCNHAWILADINGAWTPIDATQGYFGKEELSRNTVCGVSEVINPSSSQN